MRRRGRGGRASGRRRGPLVLLELASLLSGMGNGVALVALPWLILDVTGDATAAGAVAAATVLPLLFSSLFSGTVVDVVGRRRTSVLSDVLSGLSVAAIPVVAAVWGITVPWLVGLAMLGAVFDPAGASAREAMLPSAATAAGWRWDRANGLHEAVVATAYVAGPAFGGVLISTVGPLGALWCTAAGFGLSVLLVVGVRLPGAGRPARHERPSSVVRGTVEGLSFVWRDPLLRGLALVGLVLIGTYLPFEAVVLPVYFQQTDDPERFGILVTAMSAGAILGALTHTVVVRWLGRRRAFVSAVVLTALALAGIAAFPAYGLMLALSAAVGLLYGPVGPITNLAMQVRSPEAMRGRVIGVLTASTYAAGPLGLLVAGPLIDALGVQTASLILAGALLLVSLLGLVMPSLRLLDDLEPPESAGARSSAQAAGAPFPTDK